MTHNHNVHSVPFKTVLAQADKVNGHKATVLPEIESVPLPEKEHTKATIEKLNHLQRFEIGQSMLLFGPRTEWSYAVQTIQKNAGWKFRFIQAVDGLRLARFA